MKISLKTKAVTLIIIFTLILSISTVFICYNEYTNAFTEHYETLTLSIAKSTATVVNTDDFKKVKAEVLSVYSKICEENGKAPIYDNFTENDWNDYYSRFEYITEMSEYKSLMSVLQKLREDNNVESLYLGYSDLTTMKDLYLVDASREEGCLPGDCDDMEEEHIEMMKNGNYEFPAFITNYEEYGWLCSASSPIKDADGSVIGVALADISMNDIMTDRRNFLSALTLTVIIISLIMILLVIFLINKAMLKPLNKLSTAASNFVSSKKDSLDESGISKLDIKTGDEIEMLSDSIKQMEYDLNSYIKELTSMTAEKERIGAELDVATHIQSSMLPCIFPAFPERKEFDIFASMIPAKEVGGDFYDFFMIDERHLAIVMADVSGKGIPAALFMVIAKTLIKDHTQSGRDLGMVFTEVNNLLCESNSESLFVTAFEGILDLGTGEFNFVNAGHEIPYIYNKNGEFKPYKTKAGFVLAGMENIKYTSASIFLEEGDKIFQYTDGVTEATNSSNELYGSDRLNKTLNDNAHKTSFDILHGVKADIDKFVGTADQFDDITMLCLEFKEKMKDETSDNDSTQITVDALIENIPEVTKLADDFLQEHGCGQKPKMQINVAIDEIMSNIANYSYTSTIGKVTFKIEALKYSNCAVMTFIDSGIEYNPLEKLDPDVTLGADERQIGGLGIFITKKTMDEMIYEYKDGKNILTIKKNM